MSESSQSAGTTYLPHKRSKGAARTEDEDLAFVSDSSQRKKIQNRIAQRAYRKRVKIRMEELENFREAFTTTQTTVFEASPSIAELPLPQSPRSKATSVSPIPFQSDVHGQSNTSQDFLRTSHLENERIATASIIRGSGYHTAPVTPLIQECLPQRPSGESSVVRAGLEYGMDMESGFNDLEDIQRQHLLSPVSDFFKDFNNVNRSRDVMQDGKTALHIAAESGKLSTVQLLLRLQPNVLVQDSLGRTVLHSAVSSRQQAIVEELLKHNTDLEAQDEQGQTALHVAAASGFEGGVISLLAAGAMIEAKDSQGRTPFHLAAAGGQDTILELLFVEGANINAKMKL